ncbi:MAG: FdtA/QdtA family cupin domain-containing protein [Dysgonamonadaceae bacterium]|jgi:dTDP-4-dehydrorhamnose 3,5-epimerase-like enzyme|nr:FdtA/QdtA family cupin domain-containing protein [Dysgonamonadaceae bacterium]
MSEAKLIQIPKILDERGNLSFIEKGNEIDFDFKRAYWIYDVPGGEIRGGHAFREQKELIVALSGCFDVVLHNGKKECCYSLNRSFIGLYVPGMYWRSMRNFSTNAVAMVLASTFYDQSDYIRDFETYLELKNKDA